MSHENSRFQSSIDPNASGAFNCEHCGRRTRQTGAQDGLPYCPQCCEAMMWENGISDHGDPDGSGQRKVDELYTAAVQKGGTIEGYPRTQTAPQS